jgi:hypothetical protein
MRRCLSSESNNRVILKKINSQVSMVVYLGLFANGLFAYRN